MNDTFFDGLDKLYHHAKFGKIVQRAPAVCAKTWCSYVYRQDAAKRQLAGIKFTHRPKIRFFAPQGRLVSPINVKRSMIDGRLGPLGCAKFHINRHRGPKNIKNFHFLVKSPRRGEPIDRFRKLLGAFIRLPILH